MNNKQGNTEHSELLTAFKSLRQYFNYAGVFSAAVNILMLVPIIYMLQVYDRVVSSGSVSTLTMLTLLMVFLLLAMGGFEWVRSMILTAASNRIEQLLRIRIFNASFKSALHSGNRSGSAQSLSDLTSLRQFMTGNGLFAFFDTPWVPIYIAVMFLFHFWFGVVAVFAAFAMLGLAWATEVVTTKRLKDANAMANRVNAQAIGSLRNAEVIAAMGMTASIRERQEIKSDEVLQLQTEASRAAGALSSISKSFRMIVQSLTLGLGALLALQGQISPGMMIAGSLLLGRALAPIDMLVGTWKGFSVARAQYDRLNKLLQAIPADGKPMQLPDPTGQLTLDQIAVIPPGTQVPVVRGVSLALEAGQALGIVGPSASGKSTLARAILGIWPAAGGSVRLDGADISGWDRGELGPYVGYLPQDIELFDGSIADNICRFGQADAEKIVSAAKLAGVHELVLRLPQGYDTVIGAAGGVLSGGQRQRIGLARAVYGGPRLLVLDEPNSNLDDQGERELVAAIQRVKALGTTVIVITHRPLVLHGMDFILVMKEGTPVSYGPKDQVLASLMGQTEARRA